MDATNKQGSPVNQLQNYESQNNSGQNSASFDSTLRQSRSGQSIQYDQSLLEKTEKYKGYYFQSQMDELASPKKQNVNEGGIRNSEKSQTVHSQQDIMDQTLRLLTETNQKFTSQIKNGDLEINETGIKVMPIEVQLSNYEKQKKYRQQEQELSIQLRDAQYRIEEIRQFQNRKNLSLVQQKDLYKEEEKAVYFKHLIKTQLEKVHNKMKELQTQQNQNPRMTASHPMVKAFFHSEQNLKRQEAGQFVKLLKQQRQNESQEIQNYEKKTSLAKSLLIEKLRQEDLERKNKIADDLMARFKEKMKNYKEKSQNRKSEIEELENSYLAQRKINDKLYWEEKLAESNKKVPEPFQQPYKYKNPDLLKKMPELQPAFIRLRQEFQSKDNMEKRHHYQSSLAEIHRNHPDFDEMNLEQHEQNYQATLEQQIRQKRKKREEELRKYYSPQSIPHLKYQDSQWKDLEQSWQNNPENPAYTKEVGKVIQSKRNIYGKVIWEHEKLNEKQPEIAYREHLNRENLSIKVDQLKNPQKYVKPLLRKPQDNDSYLNYSDYLPGGGLDDEMIYNHEFQRRPAGGAKEIGKAYLEEAQRSIKEDLMRSKSYETLTQSINFEEELEKIQYPQQSLLLPQLSSRNNETNHSFIRSSLDSPGKKEAIFTQPNYLQDMGFKLNLDNQNTDFYKKVSDKILHDQSIPLANKKSEIQTLTRKIDNDIAQQENLLRNTNNRFFSNIKEVDELEKVNKLYLNSINVKLDMLQFTQELDSPQQRLVTNQSQVTNSSSLNNFPNGGNQAFQNNNSSSYSPEQTGLNQSNFANGGSQINQNKQ